MITANWEHKNMLPNLLNERLSTAVVGHGQLNLSQIQSIVSVVISEVKTETGAVRTGYVSGIISGNGDEHIQENIKRLKEWADWIRGRQDYPVFSPPDIFSQQVYSALHEMVLERETREEKFDAFWASIILRSVTDIFMTPGWEESSGAPKELAVARGARRDIHIVS